MSESFEDSIIRQHLEEEIGTVVAHFTLTHVPEGTAPDEIREQWLGVALPVRDKMLEKSGGEQTHSDRQTGLMSQNPDTIRVLAFDAIVALRDAQKTEAARYWARCLLSIEAPLEFRGHQGELKNVHKPSEA